MTEPRFVALATLAPGDRIRMDDGVIGTIRDKVDHAGYRKACVEVPGNRYPNRIVPLDAVVEYIYSH